VTCQQSACPFVAVVGQVCAAVSGPSDIIENILMIAPCKWIQ
jgi:hypothetical protein